MKSEPDQKEITEVEALLTELIKAVVRNPDGVRVTHLVRGTLVAFVIKTDQDDVRRVLGKQGKHFKALEAILGEAMRRMSREVHLAIDEKGPPAFSAGPKVQFALGEFNAKRFKQVKDLLKRVVSLFVFDKEIVSVTSADVANTTLLEVKIRSQDYPMLHGREVEFDYGTDGHIIGSIKNFFDGIGKNNGRILRIVVSKS